MNIRSLSFIFFFIVFSLGFVSAKDYIVTGYCNEGTNGCSICCGKWAQYNKTASGATPVAGVTCAAPRSIPFGTILKIEGVGTRIVQDRLSPKYDNRIDIFFNTHKEAKSFGIKVLDVRNNLAPPKIRVIVKE